MTNHLTLLDTHIEQPDHCGVIEAKKKKKEEQAEDFYNIL